jgi:hypothetical protein
LRRPITGDPVADAADAAQLLDVDMDQLTRKATLIAVRRLAGQQPRSFPNPIRFSQSETVESGKPSTSPISAAVIHNRRRRSIAATSRGDTLVGLQRGREERSNNSASPSR